MTLLVLLSICGNLSAQYRLEVRQQTAEAVIQLVEQSLDLTFNFNHEDLTLGRYTFSSQGSQAQILKTASSVLDRSFLQLDEGIFSLQPVALSPQERQQPLRLSGKVQDLFGTPLAGAVIWLPALEKALVSDSEGNFLIEGFYAEEEQVEVRYLGHQTQILQIKTLVNTTPCLIQLSAQHHILGEVVIKDQRPWQKRNGTEQGTVILPDQLLPMAGNSDQDVLATAQLLPGIYSNNESLGDLQTRGGPPDQTNFKWNDITVFQLSHFYGKISAINPFMVDQIAITRNGSSAEGAGQASGTIEMSDGVQPVDSLSGQFHSNLLYANLGLAIPVWKEKVHLRLAWRKSYTEVFENFVYNRFFDQSFQYGKVEDENFYRSFYNIEDVINLTPNVAFQDFSATVQAQLSERDLLKVSILRILNQLDYVKSGEILETSPTDQWRNRNLGYSFNYRRNWNEQWQTQFLWNHSDFKNEYLFLENPDSMTISPGLLQRNDLQQSAWQLVQQYQHALFQVKTGFRREYWEYLLTYGETIGTDYKLFYYNNNNRAHEHSAFAQILWQSSARWQWEGGLRWSKYELVEQALWEPRFHLSVFPLVGWTLHAHLGWYHQALNQQHLFTNFQVERGFWYLSDEKGQTTFTPLVRNRQWSVGQKYQWQHWTFTLEFYHKRMSDLWTSALDFNIHEDPYRFSDLHVQGLELGIQYQRDWLSLVWTYDRVDEELRYWDGSVSASPYAQPHRLSFFQAVQWEQWQLALHWRWASGRRFSTPSDLVTWVNDNGAENLVLEYDRILDQQLPSYHLLDLSLQYLWGKPRQRWSGKVGMSINNVYNRRNILKNEYFVNYREEVTGIGLHTWTGLPFTPNFLAELSF
ncbi:MAG: TonB-dependent receptor [Bacteroidota bacterium]